jgi:hypothetical protein
MELRPRRWGFSLLSPRERPRRRPSLKLVASPTLLKPFELFKRSPHSRQRVQIVSPWIRGSRAAAFAAPMIDMAMRPTRAMRTISSPLCWNPRRPRGRPLRRDRRLAECRRSGPPLRSWPRLGRRSSQSTRVTGCAVTAGGIGGANSHPSAAAKSTAALIYLATDA